MGERTRYGETNNEQEPSVDDSSQSGADSTETITTNNDQVETNIEQPTPTSQPPQNISDVILENTDPKQGFLTSSGTYVNIYKNAGDTERTYTSDKTVNPAGQRIDPSSAEGQIIQNQYAEQADRKVDNQAQSERFWAIREGQGSVKDLLYDTQTPEQRRLTDIFFDERNLDINTPLNQLSLSPKRYTDQRAQLMSGDDVTNRTVSSPDDKIWLKTDTPTQSTLKTFDQYKSNIITKATTPVSVGDKITSISPNTTFSDTAYNTYDLNTQAWNPTPVDDGQKQSAKDLVDDARDQGFNFITIKREREGVPDSTLTIPITGTQAYSKIENEFRKSNVYGEKSDNISIQGHVDKQVYDLPEDEKKAGIPMIAGVPYFLGGSLMFAELVKNKNNVPDMSPLADGEVRQSYESWLAGEAPSTLSQMITKDVVGTEIFDYRQRPSLGFVAVPQQLGAIVSGGVTGKLDETEFMDTALDSGIRVLTAFGNKDLGTSSQTREGSRTSVGGEYAGGGGFSAMGKQFEIESKLWGAYAPYYINTAVTEIGLIAVTAGASTVARLSGRSALSAVNTALKIKPTLSIAGQLKVATIARQISRGSLTIPMNLVFGGLGKPTSKITLESIQKLTEVQAEAFGYTTLRNVVNDDALLRNFDITPENKISDNIQANKQLEIEQTRLNQIDEKNYAEMGRTSQEGGVYDAGYTSPLFSARADGTATLSRFPEENVVSPAFSDNPIFFRDPISTQSPRMVDINLGLAPETGYTKSQINTMNLLKFDALRKQPLTTRGNPIVIPELSSSVFKVIPDEKLPSSTMGMWEDMRNTPLGFIDGQGTRIGGRESFEQALPQSDVKIGDDFIDYLKLEKLPPTTVSDFTIQDNMIRFKLNRGTEEYISTSFINPKTKKVTQTSLTGVNWSSYNPSQKTFINPSQNTIKNLMLIPDKTDATMPRFGKFMNDETGVWKMPTNEDQKMQALMIRYTLDERNLDEFGSLKTNNLDTKNILEYKDKQIEIDMLTASIKNKKSKTYKYFNNLYAPFKSKTKNILTQLNREKKVDKIKQHNKTLEEEQTLLQTLKTNIVFSKTSAEKSALKLWEVDVNRMFVKEQTEQSTSKYASVVNDPYFYNFPKSITQQERTQIAQATANTRYHTLAQDDFYNIERTIGRALSEEESASVGITLNRLDNMITYDIESTIASQRNSPSFGKSVTEYIRDKNVLDESSAQFTPTSVTLTDDFTQVTMGINTRFADTSKELLTQNQIVKAENDLRKSLLNIQGNEANFQLSTTGISTQIRSSRNMQGKQTEWMNPTGDSSKAMELNIRDKDLKILEQKELQKELDIVNEQLSGIKRNVSVQKSFQFEPETIPTKQESVTPQQLEDYLRIKDEATARLSAFPDGRPTVEKLDSSQGKQVGTKSDNTISDISRIRSSTIEDVTGSYTDPDRGFKSDIHSIADLERIIAEQKIINPQETATVSDLLWKQEVQIRDLGTGKDGIVDTGKKSDDLLAQMERIETQKKSQWEYDQAKSAQSESTKWIDQRFRSIKEAQSDLDNYIPQAKVQSDGLFATDRIGTNPINIQQGIWGNRIDTPESEYLKLLTKKENLNQQSNVIDYQLGTLNQKIGNARGKDEFGKWNKASGLQGGLGKQQYLGIQKILNFEEEDMLKQASQGDYVNVPVKSDKQESHFADQYRVGYANKLEGGQFFGTKVDVKFLRNISDKGLKKGEELDATNDLLKRFDDIRKARADELALPTRTLEFSSGSGLSPTFDKKGSLNVQQPFVTSNVNMVQGNVVPKFMTVKEPMGTFTETSTPTVLGDNQRRVYEYTNPSKTSGGFETREVFYDNIIFPKDGSLNVQMPVVAKSEDTVYTRSDFSNLERNEEYMRWAPYQSGYSQTSELLSFAIESKKGLTVTSSSLTSMTDNTMQAITNTSPDITSRVFLDQVAPDNRKLTELTLLRTVKEDSARNLKINIKKNLDEQQMLDVAKLKITEPENVPVQSMTPLGGQFVINSKGLNDKEARQLSYVLPQIGTDPKFRTIENIFENNERYKGTVYFENVYRDKQGTDLGKRPEPKNMSAEELQAWNKVKDIEMTYDKALGIKSQILDGTDNVPTKTGQVIREIENMLSVPRKYIGKKDNPNLGSQTQYGDNTNIYNIQSQTVDSTLYKANLEGTTGKLDTTDPKLVAKYEKGFLQDLKLKYEEADSLVSKADNLNIKKNELTSQLSRLEDGKKPPTYTANIYNLERIDSAPLARIKGFFNNAVKTENPVSVGIKKGKLDKKILSTQNKITSIDSKLTALAKKSDEVRTSGMESFVTNTNVKNYDPLLRVDNDVRWMKDESTGKGGGFDPDDIDPKGTPSMINPKSKPKIDKSRGEQSYASLQRILDRNAVSTAYGQTPLPFLPITAIRYPATTPQDIQDNVHIQEVPNTQYTPPQPQLDLGSINKQLDPFTPKPMSGFETNVKPTTLQSNDFGSILSNAQAMKLGIYPKSINQGLLPKIINTPIQKPVVRQGNILNLYPITTPKPLNMMGVSIAPIVSQKPRVTVPLPLWNVPLPYTKRPKRKKDKPKKVKKRKIYWDVSSSPFEPFNPKEYYTFKNEPRSVKFKEKRKNFDGDLPK